MYKISDFKVILSDIPFDYSSDFMFHSTAASEDQTDLLLLFLLGNEKYLPNLEKHPNNIAGIICNKDKAGFVKEGYNVIICDYPEKLFWGIHNHLDYETDFKTVISGETNISNRAVVAEKNVHIGKDVVIEDNVVIRENVFIGEGSVVRAGTVLGGEGFQVFNDKMSGKTMTVRHKGKVLIGANVDIHYNSCVDKALFRHMSTIIEDNCRIDNLVHLGHGVHLKKGVLVAAGAILAGYTTVGENSFVGINACTRQFSEIGCHSLVGMGSTVLSRVDDNSTVATIPARKI
jgi:UDP-3-O-[3-hydroxymyristoyl] glucosamine N-acyltransferase